MLICPQDFRGSSRQPFLRNAKCPIEDCGRYWDPISVAGNNCFHNDLELSEGLAIIQRCSTDEGRGFSTIIQFPSDSFLPWELDLPGAGLNVLGTRDSGQKRE